MEGATPLFLPLVRHRGVFTGAYSGARSTLPVGGRSLHSDPWREGLQRLLTERHVNVGAWLRALVDEALEKQKTTDGQRPRRTRLEDAHNPISPIRTQGQPTTRLDGLGGRVSGVATS